MKNFLFLLLFISSISFAQDAEEIIGKPIKIENFLVAQHDFPMRMRWEDAIKVCQVLGEGWRLPTKNELNIIYKNKAKISGFSGEYSYWSSMDAERTTVAWVQYFEDGFQASISKRNSAFVRAVKTL
jgi:hypothetical protein